MSLLVPQSIGDVVGSELMLVDYPDDWTGQAVADANGTATAATNPVQPGYYWRVERLTTAVTDADGVLVTPPSGATLMVYKGDSATPTAFRDGSQSPGLDVADQAQPITLRPGESLTFVWSDLTPGSLAYGSAQYALYQRVDG